MESCDEIVEKVDVDQMGEFRETGQDRRQKRRLRMGKATQNAEVAGEHELDDARVLQKKRKVTENNRSGRNLAVWKQEWGVLVS